MQLPLPKASISIRTATLDDALGMARVKVETWRTAYREILPASFLQSLSVEGERAQWESGMRTYPAVFRVAQLDGELVGYAITGDALDGAPGEGELFAIYALPRCWGMGVGRRLMAQAVRDLVDAGYREAVLWVFEENRRTRAFYERSGFVADGGRKVELGQPTVRYRRRLG